MTAVVIVGVQPVRVRRAPRGVAGVEGGIRPLVGQSAMETFDLAVGLWSIRTCAAVFDAVAERLAEGVRSVAGSVVSQHLSNKDALPFEPRVGAQPERGGGVLAFIGQHLRVRQPRMRVQGGVNEVISADRISVLAEDATALIGPGVAVALRASELAPASTGGDLAQLLDVDVDEIAAGRGLHATYHAAGGAVEPAQLGDAVAAQHVVHHGHVQPQQVSDSGRPPPAGDPHPDDAPLGPGRGAVRTVPRS